MLVFSVFFGRLAKVPSDGVPYPVFVFVALLPWQLFAFALTESSNSLVASQNLITKVYFPRLVIPIAAVLAGAGRFRDCLRRPAGSDAVVRNISHRGDRVSAVLPSARSGHRAGSRSLVVGAQRQVPRCALYHSVSDAVLDVCHARSPIPSSLVPEPWRPLYGSTRWPAWSKDSAGHCWGNDSAPGRCCWCLRRAPSWCC